MSLVRQVVQTGGPCSPARSFNKPLSWAQRVCGVWADWGKGTTYFMQMTPNPQGNSVGFFLALLPRWTLRCRRLGVFPGRFSSEQRCGLHPVQLLGAKWPMACRADVYMLLCFLNHLSVYVSFKTCGNARQRVLQRLATRL